jgi:ariadne-1
MKPIFAAQARWTMRRSLGMLYVVRVRCLAHLLVPDRVFALLLQDFMFEGERDISAALDAGDFSCLSPEDILKEQKKRIASVAELLNVSETTAGNLLRHFRWKQEILLTRYFEDPKGVLRELGNDRPSKAKHGSVARIRGTAECLICADEYPADECTALKACKHTFCNDCWANYLNMKINEGKVAIMTCPGHGCNSFVPEDVVQKLVSDELFAKYVRFVTKSFVEDNNNCTWCPAPNCGNAITADMVQGKIVSCTCGYRFCFTCKNEAHAPASCDEVRAWHAKMKDDSESSHWVGANTKDCPRCKVAVEKNGGCMHMCVLLLLSLLSTFPFSPYLIA